MDKFTSPFKQGKLLNAIFLSNILLSFHYYLIVYINSSFLNQYFSETQISALYIIGAIINIGLFINASNILNKLGNYKTTIYVIFLDLLAILGLIITQVHFLIGLYFVLHIVTVSFILLNLDIFIENLTSDASKTGSIRGMYLTLANITLVISPALAALLLIENKFWMVYAVSFLFLLFLLFVIKKNFKNSVTEPIKNIKLKETIAEYLRDKNLYNVFSVHFLLQLFYAFMVVYTPLYLEKNMGFAWSETGVMFTIMLLPFVLFELPVGDAEDRKYGEKEFMTIGLIIMGLATMFISFVTMKNFWVWTIILFITRVGASFVEISTDTYFFKQISTRKTDIISFYRLTRPLSFIVAPIIATIAFQFIPFQYTFIIFGALMIVGVHYSMALVDTK